MPITEAAKQVYANGVYVGLTRVKKQTREKKMPHWEKDCDVCYEKTQLHLWKPTGVV